MCVTSVSPSLVARACLLLFVYCLVLPASLSLSQPLCVTVCVVQRCEGVYCGAVSSVQWSTCYCYPCRIVCYFLFLSPCLSPTLCLTHTVSHPHCVSPTLCITHPVSHPPCLSPTLCITHTVSQPPCVSATLSLSRPVSHPHCLSPTLCPSHIAAKSGHICALVYLMKSSPELVEARDDHGGTLAHSAARGGHVHVRLISQSCALCLTLSLGIC